ncbi:hypothetical protein H7F13_04380 [Proteus vulgaris]|nr:hypothetical protein H7F13_04380 [Proteus vulgaris]
MKDIVHFNEIVNDSKGLWLSGLFGSIIGWSPDKSFYEHKTMFFSIVKKLLDKQEIKFCSPNDPLGKMIPYWDVESEVIIDFLEQHWPKEANDECDDDLNFYFYEMPALLWKNEFGNYVGS